MADRFGSDDNDFGSRISPAPAPPGLPVHSIDEVNRAVHNLDCEIMALTKQTGLEAVVLTQEAMSYLRNAMAAAERYVEPGEGGFGHLRLGSGVRVTTMQFLVDQARTEGHKEGRIQGMTEERIKQAARGTAR